MDGRAGFAVGGFIAGAAAVAVACAVTLSNSAALADVPGAAVDVDVVRVTPSLAASTAPKPLPTAKVSPAAPAPTPQVVPAPEPQDVAAPPKTTPAAPAEPAAPIAEAPAAPSEQDIETDAIATGSYERLRAWALARGWSEQTITQWVQRIRERVQQYDDLLQHSNRTQTPAQDAGSPSETDTSSWSGWKRDQSPEPPHGD